MIGVSRLSVNNILCVLRRHLRCFGGLTPRGSVANHAHDGYADGWVDFITRALRLHQVDEPVQEEFLLNGLLIGTRRDAYSQRDAGQLLKEPQCRQHLVQKIHAALKLNFAISSFTQVPLWK